MMLENGKYETKKQMVKRLGQERKEAKAAEKERRERGGVEDGLEIGSVLPKKKPPKGALWIPDTFKCRFPTDARPPLVLPRSPEQVPKSSTRTAVAACSSPRAPWPAPNAHESSTARFTRSDTSARSLVDRCRSMIVCVT
jgi:hypothetical protein